MSENILQLLDPKFPLVYEKLLPTEDHFQMTKSTLSRECPVCERPFTVFFWRINRIPFKTLICQICAKSANVCQVSLLDLDLGIPVIVRRKLLHLHQESQESVIQRRYKTQLIDKKIKDGEEWFDNSFRDQFKTIDPVLITRAQQLVEADPYLSFQKVPVCSEWLNNECKHGSSCYYSHELPKPGECSPDLSKFGVRCRYLGTVDPNGQRIIEQLQLFESKAKLESESESHSEEETPLMIAPEQTQQDISDIIRDIDLSTLPRYENGRFVLNK